MMGLAPHGACRRRRRVSRDERGVILVQVALASVVLLGFCALSIDYGVLWVARAQAQNAADAGALAAATALAFDAVTTTTLAQQSALAAASTNIVWGKAPAVVNADVTFCNAVTSTCPAVAGLPNPQPRTFFGATVNVYSDVAHGNALPTYFAPLFGVSSQEVRARATAAVAPANTVTCVWPLAIPDWWTGPDLTTFSKYQYPDGPPTQVAMPDLYNPPTFSGSSSATGIQVSNPTLSPTVTSLTLTDVLTGPANPTLVNPWSAIDKSHFVAVQIPRSDGGGFVANLTSCNRRPVRIGDVLPVERSATFAQVTTAASTLRSLDTGATWNPTTRRIQGSCAGNNTCDPPSLISPRFVALPMFNPDVYDRTRGDADGPRIEIVNFVGFYINDPNQILGNLAIYPGTADTGHPTVAYQWALLRTAVLTR